MKKVGAWIVARLDEPSTWVSFATIAGGIAVQLQSKPSLVAACIAVLLGITKAEK